MTGRNRNQLDPFQEASLRRSLVLGLLPPFCGCLAVGHRVWRRLVSARAREWAAAIAARHQ
jgi:hypothetical protein